jgi:hypothetical protein
MQLSKPPKPKATRKRLKKEILSDDFKERKILWKNIAENFLWNIFHLTSLDGGEWSASRPDRALAPGKGPPVPIVQKAG